VTDCPGQTESAVWVKFSRMVCGGLMLKIIELEPIVMGSEPTILMR